MSGINKAILIGYVGKEPAVKHLDGGRAVARFTLATTERYKNRQGERIEKTEWHNIVLWTPLAEIVEKYVKSGHKLYLEGRILSRSYESDSGETRYITEIECREMLMLTGKEAKDNQ